MKYEEIPSGAYVLPVGESIFSEACTHVFLEDEAAGLFVAIQQRKGDGKDQKITLCEEEWPAVRAVIDRFMSVCAQRNKEAS